MDIRQFVVQAPLQAGSAVRPDLGARGFVQLGLEHFREQSQHRISEQSNTAPACPQSENAPPSSHSKSLVSTHGH